MAPGKTIEPFWWSLFSVVAVSLKKKMPVHHFLHGLAIPLGWVSVSHARMLALVSQPLVKVYLFVLIALPLYHCFHRLRFVLEDLGIHGFRAPIAVLCYGSAIVGTVATLWVLIRV